MKYDHIKIKPFSNQDLNTKTTIAIVSGLVIGAAIGALFATEKGRELKGKITDCTGNLINQLTGNTKARANRKLGALISNVSIHVQRNAAGLLK